jgi:TonB-dependent starch-binding outer membrane protein SusC
MSRLGYGVLVPFLMLVGAQSALAQRRVTGTVTTEGTGAPIGDVTVLVEGTVTGTQTSSDGSFVLPQAPSEAFTIVARRIGFKQATISVGTDTNEVHITLVQDALRLQEQIVTGAATTIARVNLAHDVAVVNAEDITRTTTPTVEDGLQGKVAGAQVISNSGAPGGSMQVRLRGVASINASASPLYVIDGVVVNNVTVNSGLNAITGASSGLNSSSQDVGVNRIADFNPNDIERIEVLKGPSASAIYGSEAANGVIVITTKRGAAGKTAFSFTQRVGTQQLANSLGARRFTLDSAIAFSAPFGVDAATVQQWYQSTGGYVDWEKEIFDNHALSTESALSVRGGSETTNFFASGLLHHDEGIMPNTGYDKQSVRLNMNHNEGEKLTLGLSSTVMHTLTKRGFTGNTNDANISPYIVFASTPSFFDFRPVNGVYPVNPFTNSNILQTLALLKNPQEVYRAVASLTAKYDFIKSDRNDLSLQMEAGGDFFTQRSNLFSPTELQYEGQDGLPGTTGDNTTQAFVGTYSATLVHKFTPDSRNFEATTSLGYRGEYQNQRGINIVTQDIVADQGNVNRGTTVSLFDNRSLVQNGSIYAQEELLTLDDRLLFTVGVLGERSTNDGDVDKFYIYPKSSASYRLPSFASFIDEFKLRVAYGQTGNQPLYGMKFTPFSPTVYGGTNGVFPGSTLGAPNIEPERQTEIEGGFDVNLFGGRLGLQVTGYQKRITNMILRPTLSPSTGYSSQYINGGVMRNRGAEIGINAIPVQTGSFTWNSSVTFARNVGLVEELPIPAFVVSGFGYSYGQGRIEVGESPTQIVGWAPDSVGCPDFCGTRKYGDTEPDYTLSFSNQLSWKGLGLYGLVESRQGMSNVNGTHRKYDVLNTAADYPANIDRQDSWNNDKFGQYIEDASFVKLRVITLSYALPDGLVQRVVGRAHDARVELSGRNLWTWTKYWGLDPEVSNFGNQNILRNQDLYPYPPSRNFTFTLAVDF